MRDKDTKERQNLKREREISLTGKESREPGHSCHFKYDRRHKSIAELPSHRSEALQAYPVYISLVVIPILAMHSSTSGILRWLDLQWRHGRCWKRDRGLANRLHEQRRGNDVAATQASSPPSRTIPSRAAAQCGTAQHDNN